MQILGIRTSVKCVRYAVLEWTDGEVCLVNAAKESKLLFPAAIDDIGAKIKWLHEEMKRIFLEYPEVGQVAIKMNQFGTEKMANRYSTQLDGSLILSTEMNGKKSNTLLYANIEKGMGSKKIKGFSEQNVGKTSQYWDNQIADAIAAAWTAKNH